MLPLFFTFLAFAATDPNAWTAQDCREILTNSPWAKEVTAGVARRLTEDQLREGGAVGQPRGVGYQGVDPKGSGPKVDLNVFSGAGGDDRSARSRPRGITLKVVWESAAAVRLAELKSQTVEPPTLAGAGYQIAVYGIPKAQFGDDPKKLGDPLKQLAALKREGKKDVKPLRVEVFQRENDIAVVYLFPYSAEISTRDPQVRFEAQIGRIYVGHTFEPVKMLFLGKLVL